MEAAAPRADGPGVSLPEAHRAPLGGRGRASRGGCGTSGGQRGGSRSAEGRARYGAPGSQGFDREASAFEKGQEVRRVMGQKTHPDGFRLGYNKPWKSRWYADKDYADLLHEDGKLRKELKEKLKSGGISSIDIEVAANKLVMGSDTPRPC